jgi:hypothetical protein
VRALACSSARRAHRGTQHKCFDWRSSGRPWQARDTYVPEELQRTQPRDHIIDRNLVEAPKSPSVSSPIKSQRFIDLSLSST